MEGYAIVGVCRYRPSFTSSLGMKRYMYEWARVGGSRVVE